MLCFTSISNSVSWRLSWLAIFACCAVPAQAADPSYDTVPYSTDCFSQNWNYGYGTLPTKLMWEYTDLALPASQATAHSQTAAILAAGKYPIFDMDWDDPSASGAGIDQWNAWKNARQQYWARDAGGNINTDAYYKDAIMGAMPYDPADWPAGVVNGTRDDWDLDKILGVCDATGAVGYFAADKYDFGWSSNQTTSGWDFNPRMINAFAASNGLTIPGATTAQKSAYIQANYFSLWTDFICMGNAVKHTQLQPQLLARGVAKPIVLFQGDFCVTANRIKSMDMRFLGERAPWGQVLKRVELQSDAGRVPLDRSAAPSYFGLWACRAPKVMHGGQMACDCNEFNQSLGLVNVASGDQAEWKAKYLNQHWLSVGWAHIAGMDGKCRRGICEWLRTYETNPSVAPAAAVNLARAIKPVKPFGLAAYYSVPVERAYENTYPATGILYPLTGGMLANAGGGKIHEAAHAGVAVGYFVSDQALDALVDRPTGWLTCGVDKMPAAELVKLQAMAPVYDLNSVSYASIPSPIKFSAGACGYAFQDQNNRSIFLIWRQGRGPSGTDEENAGNTAINCTVSFSGVADGAYTATDLFNGAFTYNAVISGGAGSFTFPLARWDCRAFSCDMPSPNQSVGTPTVSPSRTPWLSPTATRTPVSPTFTPTLSPTQGPVLAWAVSSAIVVDGNLDEAGWNLANSASRAVIGSPNNTVTFGVLWDSAYLYVGVRVLDAALYSNMANIWDNDSVEVYLDANHNQGATYDAYDRQFTIGWNNAAMGGIGSATGVLHAWAAVAGGYTVEYAIPWSNLGLTPVMDMTLGFDVANNDNDSGTARNSQVMWAGTINDSVSTANFGDLILKGSPATPSATATATFTGTTTQRITPTPTPSIAGTYTTNRTYTPSATLTATPISGSDGQVLKVVAVPNPQAGPVFRLMVKLEGSVDQLQVRVYSASYILLAGAVVEGKFVAGWNSLYFSAARLGNGTYYARVCAGSQEQSGSNIAKMTVIK